MSLLGFKTQIKMWGENPPGEKKAEQKQHVSCHSGFLGFFLVKGPPVIAPFVHHPAGDVVAGGSTRVEVYRGVVLLNVELVQRQSVHEGLHQVVCGEVED